ncbi:MAG: hypothetical protein KAX49_02595 [Halanaerobiales bacterium]|nr:hypothetical protein [Halanaerobiales bacterium]
MSNIKLTNEKYSNIFLWSFVGSGVLGGLIIWIGLCYFNFSLTLVGLFQCFIAWVSLFTYFILGFRLEYLISKTKDIGQDIDQEEERKKSIDIKEKFQSYTKRDYPLSLLVVSILGLFGEKFIFDKFQYYTLSNQSSLNTLLIFIGSGAIVISFLNLLGANWFEEERERFKEGKMFSQFLRGGQRLAFLSGLAVIVKGVGFPKIEYYLVYVMLVIMGIIFLEVAFCCSLKLFFGKKEESGTINFYILAAFLSAKPITALFDSLEENMGVSFRSSWIIGFFRQSFLPLILIMILIFWGMTGFVQIQPEEQGILYRFGKIQSRESLLPGIHVKWLWPIETVQKFPVYKIQSFTVGYENNDESRDYLWTMTHGVDEYKLLLGDGKELVSINMQVFYKINDLCDYVLQFDNPVEELKAEIYRILLQEIVAINLDNLLSRDRVSFAQMIAQSLQEKSDDQRLGLEVVKVALIGIHPPIELGKEYQDIVSAKIQKNIYSINAKKDTEYNIPIAERYRDQLIKKAQVDGIDRWGAVIYEVENIRSQVQAYSSAPEFYKEWKWLETFEKGVSNKKIYLVDEKQAINNGEIWLDLRIRTEGE